VWVDGLLRRLTLPVVIICGLLASLVVASFLGYQGGALGRPATCGSIAHDYHGPTELEHMPPFHQTPGNILAPAQTPEITANNKLVACTKSAHDQVPKLVLFAGLWGIGVILVLGVVARLFGTGDRPAKRVAVQATPESLTDQLERLAKLRAAGALTESEFDAAKTAAIQRAP
jgi:hypothetical protein